ncbi:MAG: alcohol dehydrogenase [Thermodesulfobacteriota bacterium]
MARMKVAQITQPGRDFEIVERDIPEPGERQVRIKVGACGICHGDSDIKEGHLPFAIDYPRVLGHEVVGYIDKVGGAVTAWKKGQRVGVGWQGGLCFQCEPCRTGDFANCLNPQITGLTYDGGFGEYMIAYQEGLAKVPDEFTGIEAAPLLCAGITTYNSLRHAGAHAGDLVAILGVGGLGHLAIQYANKLGFNTVAIARGKESEKLASQLGAHHYIDSNETDPANSLKELGGAKVILATAPSSKAISNIINGLGANGKLVLIAFTADPIEFAPAQLLMGKKSIIGWYSGHAKDSEDALEFSKLAGIRPMVETFPLEFVNEAYERMFHGKPKFRVVLQMGN